MDGNGSKVYNRNGHELVAVHRFLQDNRAMVYYVGQQPLHQTDNPYYKAPGNFAGERAQIDLSDYTRVGSFRGCPMFLLKNGSGTQTVGRQRAPRLHDRETDDTEYVLE